MHDGPQIARLFVYMFFGLWEKRDVALSDPTEQIGDKKAILPNVLGIPVKRSRIK